jgi:hypothetical protein
VDVRSWRNSPLIYLRHTAIEFNQTLFWDLGRNSRCTDVSWGSRSTTWRHWQGSWAENSCTVHADYYVIWKLKTIRAQSIAGLHILPYDITRRKKRIFACAILKYGSTLKRGQTAEEKLSFFNDPKKTCSPSVFQDNAELSSGQRTCCNRLKTNLNVVPGTIRSYWAALTGAFCRATSSDRPNNLCFFWMINDTKLVWSDGIVLSQTFLTSAPRLHLTSVRRPSGPADQWDPLSTIRFQTRINGNNSGENGGSQNILAMHLCSGTLVRHEY